MKRGFTLIELLGVIILLGVIASIVIPISSNSIRNSREKAYNQTVKNIEDAAKLYSINSDLGYEDRYKSISLDDLKQKGFIDNKDIINPIDNEPMTGCIVYIWDLEYKQYTFEYSPECIVPEPPVEYIDSSGANKPELYDKMIPVKWNGTNWVYADTYEEWYDYNKKEWANAVVLNPGKSYSVGQDIEMTDIAMMYVWIPRYKYTIFNGNNGSIAPQEINVIFESEIARTGTITCTTNALGSGSSSEICSDNTNGNVTNGVSTYTHPAFTFGSNELAGIWVGKFEISTTDSTCYNTPSSANCNNANHTIKVLPNVDSLRYTTVSNLFTSILNIKTKYSMSNVDSHMMKNMEWGAVAYLTNSKYGRCSSGTCEEVWINNVRKNTTTYTTHTGCAGDSANAAESTNCQNEYHTTGGVKASTTGTIYGIYDMSGGANEYVMGNMVNSSGNFYSRNAGFGSVLDEKYYDKYTYDDSSNTTHSRGRLGDATKETLRTYGKMSGNWNYEGAYFPYSGGSWFNRSGHATLGSGAGVFHFASYDGSAYYTFTARSVIVAQ